MDVFKDRLSQRAKDTTRAELAHQSLGRDLTGSEKALAVALMDIMAAPQHDYAQIAAEMTKRGITAPASGRTDWDTALLEKELSTLNKNLDEAYAENGYGA
jgi:hypothetical protein|tara:strand:+ start:133599 stop:133901 length:303 start_codon:yes stop_codon:yes gene_type:complete